MRTREAPPTPDFDLDLDADLEETPDTRELTP
jgi:hypothetical protein